MARVAALDTYIPLGGAWKHVLPSEESVIAAALALVKQPVGAAELTGRKRVVLVCPGRGTYTKSELGFFSRPAPESIAGEIKALVRVRRRGSRGARRRDADRARRREELRSEARRGRERRGADLHRDGGGRAADRSRALRGRRRAREQHGLVHGAARRRRARVRRGAAARGHDGRLSSAAGRSAGR